MPVADAFLATFLDRLSLRVHLSQSDKDDVLALPQHVRSLKPAEYLIRLGDVPTHCCFMVSGLIAKSKLVADGGRQIFAVHMRGDIVDLHSLLLDRSDYSVQALTNATVVIIPREALEALAFANPSVGKALWLETIAEASISREWIVNIGRRDARTRVAHLLCEVAVRMEAAGLAASAAYELPITQVEFADIVGLTAVHINRMLKKLAALGFIEQRHRFIIIRDWISLAKAADFDPTYLHLAKLLPEGSPIITLSRKKRSTEGYLSQLSEHETVAKLG